MIPVPYNEGAEQSVLGSLILDPAAFDSVAIMLRADDFFSASHRTIFHALESMVGAAEAVEVLTVADWLEVRGQLVAAGGLAYIGELARHTGSAVNIAAYTGMIRRDALRRQLLAVAVEISAFANAPAEDSPEALLERAEQRLRVIAQAFGRDGGNTHAMKTVLANVVEHIDVLAEAGSDVIGLPTGFHDLDKMTAGLQPGHLVVLAGRPSMGKTALAGNIVEHVALEKRIAVALFSLEMRAEEVIGRMLASDGRIDQQKVRTGQLDDADWPRLTAATARLDSAPIFICDDASATPSSIAAQARAWKRQHDIGLVVVDYLQLMHVPGTKENRATEVAEISRSLKVLARELNVPVLALAQLNRSLEQRTDRRPRMADLRESGGIEQDADLIAALYREEVYSPGPEHAGKAELLILKQRSGPIGMVRLTFLAQYVRFESFIPTDRWSPSRGAQGGTRPPPAGGNGADDRVKGGGHAI